MSGLVPGKVLIVGAGGLGVPAALRLAQGGIEQLTLIDPEPIELSNLARQIIYRTADLGASKAEVAARRLTAQYPGLQVCPIVGAIGAENAAAIIAQHDFVIDATDDPAVKFLINDQCIAVGRPFAYGGVLGFFGQTMTVLPGRTACLRCLFETPPSAEETASCRDAGILGPVAGIIGTIQAQEAIRTVRGLRPELCGAILTYDARRSRSRVTIITPRPGCECGACVDAAPPITEASQPGAGAARPAPRPGASRGCITEGKI